MYLLAGQTACMGGLQLEIALNLGKPVWRVGDSKYNLAALTFRITLLLFVGERLVAHVE